MNYLNRTTKFKVILLLAGLGFLFVLVAGHAFLHLHIAPNGAVVIHSHVYNCKASSADSESTKGGHNHSNAEYYFYKAFSDENNFDFANFAQSRFFPDVHQFHYSLIENLISFLFICDYALRAPPAC